MSQSKLFHEHENEFNVLQWPYKSLNLNPIEYLWDVIECEIRIMKVNDANMQIKYIQYVQIKFN